MSRITLAVVSAVALVAAPAAAQDLSSHRGFLLGAHLVGAGVEPENGGRDNGGGLGIVAGYGFANRLQLVLEVAALGMSPDDQGEDYGLGHGDFGLRYSFNHPVNRWRPFLQGGLSWFSVAWENVNFGQLFIGDVEVSGPGLMLGGGVDLFVSPAVALGADVRFAAGAFDKVKINEVTIELEGDDRFTVNTARLQLGMKYYFSAR
jgi:opacity protein-like surface antigen